MKTKAWIASALIVVASLFFGGALARASCEGCELDKNEKDAAYFACVKYHKDHKTADDYYTERTLCREPVARAKAPEISACITQLKAAGYQYANSYDTCTKNLGFGSELGAYIGCYKAEVASAAKGVDYDATQALGDCVKPYFREHRQEVRACIRDSVKWWPSLAGQTGSETTVNMIKSKLTPICVDPERIAALPAIASCTTKLAESMKFEGKTSESADREILPENYIEKCQDKTTRDNLESILACRRLGATTMTAQYKEAGILDELKGITPPDEDGSLGRDRSSVGYQQKQQLDKCIDDAGFRADEAEILACAIENVKAFKRVPFASTRYIDGSRSAYATLEAEGKCKTPEDRRFQHKTLECVKNVTGRVPDEDLKELGKGDGSPTERVYRWCEMTVARELGAETLGSINGGHCQN